ncbi:MAG: hypothetical protein OEZ01_01855 [Candidatus Heimdallarchaeota archaeon]|nr:hypothetical protein [Candidatus Heimdallarchaeota archaeon]MDH5644718.1 hypothetical protein [Candidatus Heimdallarchaeota archaeon]
MSDIVKQLRSFEERDEIANRLSDLEIHKSVIKNILNMENASSTEKVDIMFEAVPDFGIIASQLGLSKSTGELGKAAYTDIMNKCIVKIKEKEDGFAFNPLFLNED